MKSCEGILIASDYDGTFALGDIPKQNISAVREFCEAGGLFTFCSGRRGSLMDGNLPCVINAPMISMCGGEIYDFASHRPLERYPFTGDVVSLLRDAAEAFEAHTVEINYEDELIYIKPEEIPDALPSPVYKAVIFHNHPEILLPDCADEVCRGRCDYFANGYASVELLACGHNKGTTAQRVKEITGAHTLIGIGDYQGDVPLLEAADIGIAVKNALTCVKEVADRVVCDVREGAIAEVIYSLL